MKEGELSCQHWTDGQESEVRLFREDKDSFQNLKEIAINRSSVLDWVIEQELLHSVVHLRGSPLWGHVTSSTDRDEAESVEEGLEAGNLSVVLPRRLLESSAQSKLIGELLSHHEVAGHVCISVVEQHANVVLNDLLDERSHVSVLLLIGGRDLVTADIPLSEVERDVNGLADLRIIHVREHLSVVEARNVGLEWLLRFVLKLESMTLKIETVI